MNMNNSKSNKVENAGFDYRIVEYEKIHKIKDEYFDELVDAVDPQNGEIILDGMDGYGSASKRILARAKKLGYIVEIYTLDESVVQIERARENVPDLAPDHIIQADMRESGFPSEKFDKVVIKMGIHEVPKDEQIKIFKEVLRILKPGGKFVIWELALDKENQKLFQDFIRKKDELAGFDQLVKNRYFPRHDELYTLFIDAGFVNVKDHFEIQYQPSTWGRQEELVSKERKILTDQNGVVTKDEEEKLTQLGKDRARQLAEFARANFPEHLKERMKYMDLDHDVQFEIKKIIMGGFKPTI